MNQFEESIKKKAIDYVKKNKKKIIEEVVGDANPVNNAVAIFMAGSPGAGKTEFSKHFIEQEFNNQNIVRIDPDEIRERLPGYNGKNAYLFQKAVIKAVEKVLDYVFAKNIHFLLDGTFSNQNVANKNIKRAIKHNRIIQINYVYQPPEIAWNFTQERELVMKRRITKEVFEDGLKNSRLVVANIKKEFKNRVIVDLITRNIKTNKYKYYFNRSVAEINNIDKKSNMV